MFNIRFTKSTCLTLYRCVEDPEYQIFRFIPGVCSVESGFTAGIDQSWCKSDAYLVLCLVFLLLKAYIPFILFEHMLLTGLGSSCGRQHVPAGLP